jgi:hypothetical protein
MTQFQPTFALKKVDPLKVLKLYSEGAYKSLKMPLQKINVEAVVVPTLSTTQGLYTFRDKNNCIITIYTSNNEVLKELPAYKPRCFWCMQDLPTDIKLHVPIPTFMHVFLDLKTDEYHYYFETNAGGKGGGCCCSFECGSSYLKHFNEGRGACLTYSNEQKLVFLQTLYTLCHPDKGPLKDAPDFRLLHFNAGAMSVDEFIKTKSQFVLLPNIILNSGMNQYMVQTLNLK